MSDEYNAQYEARSLLARSFSLHTGSPRLFDLLVLGPMLFTGNHDNCSQCRQVSPEPAEHVGSRIQCRRFLVINIYRFLDSLSDATNTGLAVLSRVSSALSRRCR